MLDLAKQIVIDGEGAKKIIEVRVENAKSISSAKNIAFSIANSLSEVRSDFLTPPFVFGTGI